MTAKLLIDTTFTDVFGLTADNFGFEVVLDNGCVIPHDEVYLPPPAPNCDAYTIGDFSFLPWAHIALDIYNGDTWDTRVESIELDWGYAEDYDRLVGASSDLNVDFFSYGGLMTWGNDNGNDRDYNSTTYTNVDSPASFPGSWSAEGLPPFGAGQTYTYDVDFDEEWANFSTDLLSDDFGVVFTFSNGCTLIKTPVPRPLPEPNCDLYSITDFNMIAQYNHIEAYLTNGDILSTQIDRIVFDWDNAEALGDVIHWPEQFVCRLVRVG